MACAEHPSQNMGTIVRGEQLDVTCTPSDDLIRDEDNKIHLQLCVNNHTQKDRVEDGRAKEKVRHRLFEQERGNERWV